MVITNDTYFAAPEEIQDQEILQFSKPLFIYFKTNEIADICSKEQDKEKCFNEFK